MARSDITLDGSKPRARGQRAARATPVARDASVARLPVAHARCDGLALALTRRMAEHRPVYACDVMQRDVKIVRPATSLLDLHQLLVSEEIHGVPVLRADGYVDGVISALDVLRVIRDELQPGAQVCTTTYFRDETPYDAPDWTTLPDFFADRMRVLTAADVMTRDVIMVAAAAPVEDVASTMLSHHVHRVLVGDRRALAGVITTFDLLPVMSRVLRREHRDHIVEHTGYRRETR